jgi:glutamine cyclotransferase
VRRLPHDPASFTQGLAWRGSVLYEGSGLYGGASTIRRVSLAGSSYSELSRSTLDGQYFGEGVALWPPEAEDLGLPPSMSGSSASAPSVLQLTWNEGVVLAWDADSLQSRGSFPFSSALNSGWGLTHNGADKLFMSDGSHVLHTWDPAAATNADGGGARVVESSPRKECFEVTRGSPGSVLPLPPGSVSALRPLSAEEKAGAPGSSVGGDWWPSSSVSEVANPLQAIAPKGAVGNLNELEFAHGWVLANLWTFNQIAFIDPATGSVPWFLDFSVLKGENAGRDVLNGMAYTMRLDCASSAEQKAADAAAGRSSRAEQPWGGRLWVTGKNWDFLYEIELGGLVQASLLGDLAARGSSRRAAAGTGSSGSSSKKAKARAAK